MHPPAVCLPWFSLNKTKFYNLLAKDEAKVNPALAVVDLGIGIF
jgi:hypothetical protein